MLSKGWRLACLGFGALAVSMSQAHADDTIRLGGKGSIQDAGANLMHLDLRPSEADDDEDTVPVWHRYRYGYGGGYYGGFSGGFYRGYSSYRYYPRYSIGFSYYQPRYYGGYYGGGYGFGLNYGSFYGGYRSYYSVPAYYYGGFCRIGGTIEINPTPPSTLQLKPIQPIQPIQPMNPNLGEPVPANPQQLPVPQNPNDGFRYDGGPANPVPMPQGTPEPKGETNPRPSVPDRAVSLPVAPSVTPTKKYQYAAYGEKPKTESVPKKADDTLFVKTTKK